MSLYRLDSITNTEYDDWHALLDLLGMFMERLAVSMRASVLSTGIFPSLFSDFYSFDGREDCAPVRLRDLNILFNGLGS